MVAEEINESNEYVQLIFHGKSLDKKVSETQLLIETLHRVSVGGGGVSHTYKPQKLRAWWRHTVNVFCSILAGSSW